MKTIGLLGGMSWQSTVPYYRTINRVVGERLGDLHSAEILLYSVDFQPLEELQRDGRWEEVGERLAGAARSLERAGADFLVLCTNTMHKVAPRIEAVLSIPLLHVADATAARVTARGVTRVGLLGTRFTMDETFYRGRLEERGGFQVVVPPAPDRERIDRVIFRELCRGELREESRRQYRRVVRELAADGCQGVILGCTEIGLLLAPEDSPVPLFDTAAIHAERAALFALEEEAEA